MTWLWWVVALFAVTAVYLSWTAGRVDRLHHRMESTLAALDAQLFRRSGVAIEVATARLLDPVTSLLLADAARQARSAPEGDERETAESALSRTLVTIFEDPEQVKELAERPGAVELLDELGAACRRVEMARRFYNDTVVMARRLRSRRIVRWFHLAGYTPWPETAELDSTVPVALSGNT